MDRLSSWDRSATRPRGPTIQRAVNDRERRLRQTFGPPVAGPHPAETSSAGAKGPRRVPKTLFYLLGVALLVIGGLGVFLAETPNQHVAAGCYWWTAMQVGDVNPGSHGCVRGYFSIGGWLSESTDPNAYSLFLSLADPDQPARRPNCPFVPRDAVVVRYHAVADGGQTIIGIDDCR